MCPACLTTLAVIMTGSTAVSGLTAVVVDNLRDSTATRDKRNTMPINKESDHDADHHT
jgi:hypothetical protein